MSDDAHTTEPRGLPASRIWYGLLATLGVVLVLLFFADVPERIARWHWAAAYDRYLDGDVSAALAALEAGFAWDDELWELYYQRGGWRMEQGEFEKSLADFDRALDLMPQTTGFVKTRLDVTDLAAQALRRLGKCQEMSRRLDATVAMIDRLSWEGQPDNARPQYRARALNGRAYANALCGENLAQSLGDVKEAIRELREAGVDSAGLIDTYGYVLLRLEIYALAAVQFERAVAIAEEEANDAASDEARSERYVDRRPVELSRKQRRQVLAVLYQHRGLAYEQLGRLFDAEQDFARAKRLGYDPEHAVE